MFCIVMRGILFWTETWSQETDETFVMCIVEGLYLYLLFKPCTYSVLCGMCQPLFYRLTN